MATRATRAVRIGRLERPALTGVLVREIVNFSSYWRSATFSSTVEPTIYLLAFGFGFGSLVSTVAGYDYVEFVGTGTVATAVLFSSAFPGMFGTFIKYKFQRTYDAILAAEPRDACFRRGGHQRPYYAISSPVSSTKTSSRLAGRRSPSRRKPFRPSMPRIDTLVPVRRVRRPADRASASTSASRAGPP